MQQLCILRQWIAVINRAAEFVRNISHSRVTSCFPAGGYLAHSLAIMTDAAHLLTDFGSMMVSLFSLWISSRPPTKTMNFGWHRSGQDERYKLPLSGWKEERGRADGWMFGRMSG